MIKVIESFRIAPLLACYFKIEREIVWTDYRNKGRQAGLQFKEVEDPWSSAVGVSKGAELAYTNLNPFFKNTIFEEIINKYNLLRTRLMWISPMSCYSMHKDTTPRIHLPLITNPECYFVFKQGIVEHLKAGKVYQTNTLEDHTFINCSNQSRLHLVGVIDKNII